MLWLCSVMHVITVRSEISQLTHIIRPIRRWQGMPPQLIDKQILLLCEFLCEHLNRLSGVISSKLIDFLSLGITTRKLIPAG